MHLPNVMETPFCVHCGQRGHGCNGYAADDAVQRRGVAPEPSVEGGQSLAVFWRVRTDGDGVIVDLLVATSKLDARQVQTAVPPACRRPAVTLAAAEVDDDRGEALLTVADWVPRVPAVHLVPAFSALTASDWSARFEMSVLGSERWSPWIGAASLGPAPFDAIAGACSALAADIDVFLAPRPVEAVRLRVRLRADDVRALLAAPWLLTLSAAGGDGSPATGVASPLVEGPARLVVPALSQMAEDPAIAMRVCSPVSVAMVLGFWGRPVEVATIAAEVHHAGLDRYGVWPAAIRAAARRGVAGYLLRFPDWGAAAWCLGRGLPVIASIRYEAGELDDAAIAATDGHLVVLTGYDDGTVLVNDPAAPDAGTVARRYRLDQLTRAWLTRSGIGYVLFPPETLGTATSAGR